MTDLNRLPGSLRQNVAAFLLLAVVIAASGYFYYAHQEKQIRKELRDELSAIADLKVGQITAWQNERLGDAEVFRSNETFIALARQFVDHPTHSALERSLQRWLLSFKQVNNYKCILLLDGKGHEVVRVGDTLDQPGQVARGLAKRAFESGRIQLSDLERNDSTSGLHSDMVVPLVPEGSSDSTPVAALLFRIDPWTYLFPLMKVWPTSSRTAETLVIRREGDSVVYLNDLRHRTNATVAFRLSMGETLLGEAGGALGQNGVVEGVDYRGGAVLAAIRNVPGTSWFLIAKIDLEEVNAPVRRQAWYIAAFMVTLLLAGVSGITSLWNHQRVELLKARARVADSLRESEAKFRGLYENLRDAFVSMDMSGEILEFNSEYCRMLGYEPDEIRQLTYQSITPERWHDFEAKIIEEQIIPRGYSDVYEKEYVKKDGTVFPVELRAICVTGKDQKPVGMWAIVRDITERKRVEKAMHESEERYRELVTLSPDALYVHVDGYVTLVNPAMCTLLGADQPAQLLGKSVFEIVHPDYHELVRERWKRVFSGRSAPPTEEQFVRLDGTVVDVEVVAVAVDFLGRKEVQVIARDITQRKQAEDELRRASKKYRDIFEGVPMGLYQSTVRGEFLAANREMAKILGFESPEDLVAATSHTGNEFYVNPGRRAELMEMLQRESTVAGFESRAFRKDGSIIWVSESARALCDQQGNLTGFEGTATDITARKIADESLQRLLQAVEQTNDIIFMTDRDGKIKYVNPAFSKIYGYSPEEVYDRTPRMLKSGMSDGASYTAFWEKILARQNIRAEWTNRTKDGRLVTVDSTVSPVLGGHGGLSGFVAVQRDVTLEHQNQKDRKVLENQLYEAQKLESIGTLAGGIAHDFNNVLAIVLGYIALLKNAPGDVQNVENVTEAVSTAVQRGADLVRQILVFARKTEVSFAPLEVNLLVTEVQKMVQETFPRTIAVKAELDTNILLIDADRTQVYQTLLNLCVNARDAMPKGGTISIATRKVAGYQLRDRFPGAEETDFVNVSVADTGVGMNQATRKRVFEPFFTTKGKEKGTGLGLSVVYGIMKSHQGYVDVQSVMGQGTTFDLFFPVRHEVPPAKATGTEEEHTPVGGTESILVVEDEALLRDLLKTILAANGYNVFIASDGEEAVSVYKNHHKEIALVIADLGLPKLDGTGVFDHLRMINPGVKVLIASGYIDPGVKSGLLKAGAMGFLQKPMRPDETVRRVREALDRD